MDWIWEKRIGPRLSPVIITVHREIGSTRSYLNCPKMYIINRRLESISEKDAHTEALKIVRKICEQKARYYGNMVSQLDHQLEEVISDASI